MRLTYASFVFLFGSLLEANPISHALCEYPLIEISQNSLEHRLHLYKKLLEPLSQITLNEYFSTGDLSLQNIHSVHLSSQLQILKEVIGRFSEAQRAEYMSLVTQWKIENHHPQLLVKNRDFLSLHSIWSSVRKMGAFGFSSDSKQLYIPGNYPFEFVSVQLETPITINLLPKSMRFEKLGIHYVSDHRNENYAYRPLYFSPLSTYEFVTKGYPSTGDARLDLIWVSSKKPFAFFRRKKKKFKNWLNVDTGMPRFIYFSKTLNKIIVLGKTISAPTGGHFLEIYGADVNSITGEPSEAKFMGRLKQQDTHCIDPNGQFLFSIETPASVGIHVLRQFDLKSGDFISEWNLSFDSSSSISSCFVSPDLKYIVLQNEGCGFAGIYLYQIKN